MSEARLLLLVARYPHRAALARHVRDGSIFATLGRLEDRGLVTRGRELYRLTRCGEAEVSFARALGRLVGRSLVASA